MDKIAEVRDQLLRIAKSIIAMSKFLDKNGFRFGVYSFDLGERAHVHVDKDGRDMKFWLLPKVELFQPNGTQCPFTPKEVRDCKKIIIQHKQEFLDKFYDALEKSGWKNSLQERKKSPSGRKKGSNISPVILRYLPIVEDLFRILPEECIDNACGDDDEKGCMIAFFPNENGEEPWIEVCWARKYRHQHVRFETGKTENEHYNCFFEYEEFVTPENKDEILQNVLKYVLQVYGGTKIKDQSRIKRIFPS